VNKFLVILGISVFGSLTYADQGGLISNSGGSLGAITITNPPGTLSIAPTNLTFTSSDGTTFINAVFSNSNTVESCSGGGKGGHVTCSFTFTGAFSGTLTVNGQTQAINGTTTQVYGSTGIIYGSTGYNSAYTPFYFTDGNARILRSDDLSGTNAIAYGTQGFGTGQFYGPSGIALDSAGRIYIADTYNDRIVRIDDMNGTNWTSLGTYGSDVGQFSIPQSVSVDPAGHIWVVDNGNGRLVRMDDMNGTNWITVGTNGTGIGQFASFSSAPGFDSLGRIYVADTGNRRIVRFDDLNFTNWTTLSQSQPVGPYIFMFGTPSGVVVDPAGKIYVADNTNVIRVDDMTGANWTSISLGTFPAHTIAVDPSGMVLLGNGYNAQIDDSQSTVLTSNINGLVQGVYVSVYGAVPIPLPSPRPSAIGFTPNTLTFSQNAGTTSPAQLITINNFGGSPLNGLAISATSAFSQTNTCSTTLVAGSNCTVSVTFTPSGAGPFTGTVNITDDSGNMGSAQTLALNGTGTTPGVAVTPASLSFPSQVVGTTSTARTITLQSTGTGPLQVASITAAAPFSQTSNCIGAIAPGASCTIQVTFAPVVVGSATGSVTITDNAGTQTVSLSGNGSAPVSLSSTSLNFGGLAVGSTSVARTVTVTNRLSTVLTFTSIATTGPFALASNTCGASIAANGNCIVGVTFTPTTLGAATGVLTFTDSANTSPQTVNLSGTGSAPVTFSASSLSFGTVTVGKTSSAKTVTLTNHLSVALSMSSVAASAGFNVTSNTCGASVPAGGKCTVGVTFSPTATGAVIGTLTFTDSAATSPQAINLSGTGR
jgi:sugar lactone lactonase YvrE